jgi:glycosyltransferase involved in cell wall biosynthesis
LHGYLTAELGMGELARLVMKATEVAGIPCSPTVNTRHLNRSEADVSVGSNAVVYPIDVLVINADQTLAWAAENLSGGSDRLRVGVWAWEVEEFPDEFSEAFEVVDEVWAISTFSQRAIQRKTNKPVFTIPLPQKVGERESVKPFDFSTVGLAADPYFLVMFDYLSVIDRKNPFAAIEAFKAAFSRDESVRLVIKTINGHQKFIDRERLLHAIGDEPRIQLIEDYLTSDQVTELVCGAVAFVSLHRSEGYGLTCADAMGLRVPVIATAYSGNMDFMNESNSLLVPYSLVPVDASVQVYPTTTVWAEADVSVAAQHMQKLFFDPSTGRSIGDQGYESIRRTDTLTQSADFISARIASLMMKRTSPTQVRTGVLRRLARLLPGPVKARLKRLKRLKSAL